MITQTSAIINTTTIDLISNIYPLTIRTFVKSDKFSFPSKVLSYNLLRTKNLLGTILISITNFTTSSICSM